MPPALVGHFKFSPTPLAMSTEPIMWSLNVDVKVYKSIYYMCVQKSVPEQNLFPYFVPTRKVSQ